MNLRNSTSLSVVLLFSLTTLSISANRAGTGRVPEEVKAQALVNYGKLPLSFEENRGQADARVKFVSHGSDYSILLAPSEVFLNLQRVGKAGHPSTIRMSFPGAQSSPAMAGAERQSAISSYFVGNNPAKWVTGAPNFSRVHYRQLYPGVDLAFYGNQGQLEYDFVVAPGANPKNVQLQFDGVDSLRLDRDGSLVLSAANGEIRQHKPIVYQPGAGGREVVEGRYVIQSHNRVTFEVARYDSRKPLIIDPVLTFGTYLGSPGDDLFGLSAAASTATYPAVAVDPQGNVYVAGFNGGSAGTFTGNPTILTANQGGGGAKVFVVKMNSTGSGLLYSVVFGGSLTDIAGGIAVDAGGNAYVTGSTNSADFPTTAGAPQTVLNPTTNAFVAKVNAAGSALVYSTYLGGSGNFGGNGIALDPSGNAYITGTASASGGTPFPLVNPLSSTPSSGFLTELNSGGTAFSYSTYLSAGIGYGIAVDTNGNAYVTGSSGARLAPSPAQGYVLKVDTGGTVVGYGPVYLGNSGPSLQTIGFGIALDTQNDAYVTGMTNDPNFPQISSAAQSRYGGGLTDGFALKLNPTGGLVYGTYIGGLGTNFLPERGSGIGVDQQGNAYVSGTTECIGFPLANQIAGARNGGTEVLMRGTLSGTGSTWSPTSLAGNFDQVTALAFDPSGNLYAGTSAVNAAGGGVYKLASGGSTWSSASSGITSSTIDSIAVDPNTPSTVYAAGSGHLYQSTNGGGSWTQLSQPVGTAAAIAVAKSSPSTVYVGSSAGLIYSTNAGSSWNTPAVAPGPAGVNALVVDPQTATTAYAGTPSGVYQTVNGGKNWTAAPNGLPTGLGGVVTSMAVGINGSTETFYAATPNGLFYTTNAGASWTKAVVGGIASTPLLVAVDSADNVYVAFAGAAVATATNGGTQPGNWSGLTYSGLTQNQVLSLAVPPAGSGTAYAGMVAATTAFLTEISPTGQSFLSSTCIGGTDNNLGQNIAVTPGGAVYVSGATLATNFPTSPGAIQKTNAGISNAFVVGAAGSGAGFTVPTVVVQTPVAGTILDGSVTVSGYALDAFSSGSAIASVQVFLDGSLVTNATYGAANPAACSIYPGAPGCPNVGFTYQFATSSLTAGSHTLSFEATDSSTPPNIATAVLNITIKSGPAIPYDFNGGPGPDVIWEDPTSGFAQVWYLGGALGATVTGAADLTQTNPWHIVGVADFDGNGTPDVVWQDPVSGAVQVWFLGGPGGNVLMGAANIVNKNPWKVVSIADFNQDGHPDLLWEDPTSGFSQVWYMGGPQGLNIMGDANLDQTNPWHIVGTGDFNGDGVPDVLWQDPVSGTVQIWYMGGTTAGQQGTQFQTAVNLTANSWHVVAIADFNQDGHPDVVFEDPATGSAQIFYYNGAGGTTLLTTAVLSGPNPWYIAGPH
ncbi:MAG: SBBP repeat-containing protein [Bryobacteraceae bacterium]